MPENIFLIFLAFLILKTVFSRYNYGVNVINDILLNFLNRRHLIDFRKISLHVPHQS